MFYTNNMINVIDDFNFETDDEKKLLKELEMLECLTQKRIEMIKMIARFNPKSIRELSRLLERNIKNVFEDLILLQKNRFISFENKGKSRKPIVSVKKVVFYFNTGKEEFKVNEDDK